MDKSILAFIEKLEVFKTKIKALHWDANSLSQHELCDDIADRIAEFQDQVSEVEQSISGKLGKEMFRPDNQEFGEVGTLKEFVENVIEQTNAFYKKLEGKGDKYIGMRSDCESFLSDMQRKLYLVNFTMKEDLKRRLKAQITESMPKNLANHDEVDKFMGRRPKTMKARINQIYRIVKKYGIDSKVYHDDYWQAKDDYYRAITSLGCDFEMIPCANSNRLNDWDDITSDGGYTDYGEDGMPRSKQYAIKIMYDDGMNIGGYIKFMAAGRVDDPFSAYDTCMILWPKNNRELSIENRNMNKQMRLTEAELKQVVKEAAMKLIKEYGDNPETREKMALAAKRDIKKGSSKGYENAMNSLMKRGSTKDEFDEFQKDFENESREIKLTESELKSVIKEAAMKILSETPLNYDIDNFSGRWNKYPGNGYDLTSGDEYIDDEGYLDDPYKKNEIEDALKDDEWEWGKDMDLKGAENYYSWDRFEHKPIAQGLDPYYKVGKRAVGRETDDAINMRNRQNDWSDRELRHGRRMMDKWVNGQRDNEDLEDAWDDLHYESKEPMKVTESELKQVVKEAAMKLIKEYGDTPKGQYLLNKLAARQRFRDKDPHKGARTLYYARFHAPEDEREYKKLAKARELGYKDGQNEFGADYDPFKDFKNESIEIKPENKGKFTATKKATGKSTEELTHSKNPLTRKRAIFAQNAKKWNHSKK